MQAALSPSDRSAIEDLLTAYCWRLDHAEGESAAALFEEACSLSFMGRDLAGRPAIAETLGAMSSDPTRVVRHVWSNLRIVARDGDTAHLTTIAVTYVAPIDSPAQKQMMLGDSHDVVRRGVDGSWRFVSRRLNEIMPFAAPL